MGQRVGHVPTARADVSTTRQAEHTRERGTHFLTESNAKAPVQNVLLARPPDKKLAVPWFMSGAYLLNPRRMISYERNLRAWGT